MSDRSYLIPKTDTITLPDGSQLMVREIRAIDMLKVARCTSEDDRTFALLSAAVTDTDGNELGDARDWPAAIFNATLLPALRINGMSATEVEGEDLGNVPTPKRKTG